MTGTNPEHWWQIQNIHRIYFWFWNVIKEDEMSLYYKEKLLKKDENKENIWGNRERYKPESRNWWLETQRKRKIEIIGFSYQIICILF